MITIFTIPKAFKNKANIIQRKAIGSWTKLFPKCEIILFGNDEGVDKVAQEFGCLHVSEIEKTELGTPLLSSAISLTQEKAKYDTLLYLNTDIILMSDLIPSFQKVKEQEFLISGQRWDVDVEEKIDFRDIDWENKLREKIKEWGKLHGPTGMDYFLIPKNLPDKIKMPGLAVGRPGWDNWLIYQARFLKIPVINATGLITAIHQNHDYSHSPWGRGKKVVGPEYKKNIKLAGGFANMMTLVDADWILTEKGLKKPDFIPRVFSTFSLFYPWRLLLSIKRRLQQFL